MRTTAFALAALAAVASASSDVSDLTKDSFPAFVQGDSPSLVEFFAPWCVSALSFSVVRGPGCPTARCGGGRGVSEARQRRHAPPRRTAWWRARAACWNGRRGVQRGQGQLARACTSCERDGAVVEARRPAHLISLALEVDLHSPPSLRNRLANLSYSPARLQVRPLQGTCAPCEPRSSPCRSSPWTRLASRCRWRESGELTLKSSC